MTLVRLTGLNDTRHRQDVQISSWAPTLVTPERSGSEAQHLFLAADWQTKHDMQQQQLTPPILRQCKRRLCKKTQVLDPAGSRDRTNPRCATWTDADGPPVSQPHTFAGCRKHHRPFLLRLGFGSSVWRTIGRGACSGLCVVRMFQAFAGLRTPACAGCYPHTKRVGCGR